MTNVEIKQLQTKNSKIAISSESDMLDGGIDSRFGRAGGFIIFDLKTNEFEYLDNGSSQVKHQGAGIDTASKLVSKGVKAVLTGFVGPKAYRVLETANIEIVQGFSSMSVRKAIDSYKEGKVSFDKIPLGAPKKKLL